LALLCAARTRLSRLHKTQNWTLRVTPIPPIAENKYDAPAQDRTRVARSAAEFSSNGRAVNGGKNPRLGGKKNRDRIKVFRNE
jgi:hypothetical protein